MRGKIVKNRPKNQPGSPRILPSENIFGRLPDLVESTESSGEVIYCDETSSSSSKVFSIVEGKKRARPRNKKGGKNKTKGSLRGRQEAHKNIGNLLPEASLAEEATSSCHVPVSASAHAVPGPVGACPVESESAHQAQAPQQHFHPPGVRKNPKKGKALDLFSGTGSVARRLSELGYDVVSLDIDPRSGSTITMDLLDWTYTVYPPGYFKIVAASVPCAEYSIAKTTAPRDFERADELVHRVLEIVEYFGPKIWWIENPRTGYLKDREMMENLDFVDIDYCQFSDWGYQKPTRFWGSPSLGKLLHKKCPGTTECPNIEQTPEGVRHREKLGGNSMKFNTREKGRIPPG